MMKNQFQTMIENLNEWTHSTPPNLDATKLDNFELMTHLYQILKGGDELPQPQKDQFRAVYWEIYDRFTR